MICPHCHKDTEVATPATILNNTMYEYWFDAFWQLYPLKKAKKAAQKAWKKAATSEAIKDEIMAALKCQLGGMSKLDKSLIPHASTWLNGRRWEDEQGAYQIKGDHGFMGKPRVIACELCGDSGICSETGVGFYLPRYKRCSCARGQLPGLVIPQAEEIDSTPF